MSFIVKIYHANAKCICFCYVILFSGDVCRRPQEEGKTGICPLGNCDEEPKFSRKPQVSSLIPINWINSCDGNLFDSMSLTLQKSQIHRWCHAVINLQCTHTPSFTCKGRLQKLRVDCCAGGLFCVTITWQQIFKRSLYAGLPIWLFSRQIFKIWLFLEIKVSQTKSGFFGLF